VLRLLFVAVVTLLRCWLRITLHCWLLTLRSLYAHAFEFCVVGCVTLLFTVTPTFTEFRCVIRCVAVTVVYLVTDCCSPFCPVDYALPFCYVALPILVHTHVAAFCVCILLPRLCVHTRLPFPRSSSTRPVCRCCVTGHSWTSPHYFNMPLVASYTPFPFRLPPRWIPHFTFVRLRLFTGPTFVYVLGAIADFTFTCALRYAFYVLIDCAHCCWWFDWMRLRLLFTVAIITQLPADSFALPLPTFTLFLEVGAVTLFVGICLTLIGFVAFVGYGCLLRFPRWVIAFFTTTFVPLFCSFTLRYVVVVCTLRLPHYVTFAALRCTAFVICYRCSDAVRYVTLLMRSVPLIAVCCVTVFVVITHRLPPTVYILRSILLRYVTPRYIVPTTFVRCYTVPDAILIVRLRLHHVADYCWYWRLRCVTLCCCCCCCLPLHLCSLITNYLLFVILGTHVYCDLPTVRDWCLVRYVYVALCCYVLTLRDTTFILDLLPVTLLFLLILFRVTLLLPVVDVVTRYIRLRCSITRLLPDSLFLPLLFFC